MAKFYAVKELISRKYFEGEYDSGIGLSPAPVKYMKLAEAKRVAREYNKLFDSNRIFRVVELNEKVVEDDHN